MNITTPLEKLTQRMEYYRTYQSRYGHDKHDDARSPGELLDAAIAYLETARTQLKTRDPYAIEDYGRNIRGLYGNSYKHRVVPGGSEIGFNTSSGLKPERHERLPNSIPWEGAGPAHNMFIAGAFILSELQRIEREELRVINANAPKKAAKNEGAHYEFEGPVTSPDTSKTVTFSPSSSLICSNSPLVFQP